MPEKSPVPILSFILAFILISLACAIAEPVPTSTPHPSATGTAVPTKTSTPSPTPTPTQTPDATATQQAAERNAEVRTYFDKGYLATTEGEFIELEDFSLDWAQLGWYNWLRLGDVASDFFLSAHFKWDSAFRNSDISGCGLIFALQENDDHYAVFLDRSKVFFLITDRSLGYSRPVGTTRGTGRVKFDYPAEADFTLAVKDNSAYVLVNGEFVGEYTLARSRPIHGTLGLTVLSGTNRGYGTRCEMTNMRLWIANQQN
ncbi:MAG TPA: hypothetical protein VI524_01875 [Anaerolineales bacterium]|nr:hypothetical protein [Anaerolineales bacterium]